MARRWYFRPLIVLVIIGFIAAAYQFVFRPWYTHWGATPAEIAQALPGDDLVAQPARAYTRAITIHAPADKIWPWLAQFGQAEAGMYSYTGIEQAIGCDMHNTDRIVPEWQTVEVGGEVRMCQEGYGPAPYRVAAVDPGKALIMGHHPEGSGDTWSDTWVLVISPVDANTSRLFLRTRTTLTGVMWDVIDPGVFLMECGMLNGIKERAEALAGDPPVTPWGWIILGALSALIAMYVGLVRPWHLRWGATREEVAGERPGDTLLPGARIKTTHAVTIKAAPSEVWPWLLQMGQGRAGMYSYEFIENRLMGLDIHNANRIIPEFQGLKVGDIVPLAPDNFGPSVAILEPLRALVLSGDTRDDKGLVGTHTGDYWMVSWGFYLDEQKDGSTRLVERWWADWKPDLLNFLIYRVVMEFGAFIMERRMLLGIKARAEALANQQAGG